MIKLPPYPNNSLPGTFAWNDWINKLRLALTDVQNTQHNSLLGLQGGNSTERYHLTAAEYALIGNTMSIKQIVRDTITIASGASSQNYTLSTAVDMNKTLVNMNGWSGFQFSGTFPAGDVPYLKLTSTTNLQAFRYNTPSYSAQVVFELIEYN